MCINSWYSFVVDKIMNDVTVGDIVSVTWKLNDLYIQNLMISVLVLFILVFPRRLKNLTETFGYG